MALARMWFASLLFASACSAAHADPQIASPGVAPHIALSVAPARLRAPYDVQILRADGEALPTYGQRDRFYVQGSANERYVIRITNPTERRIEAVVSVDGLDVIDGENGDLRKRGYVVPPFGETRIEGFRTSQADVATFRFSSVGGSYAGQKGKARNVGVIAVALFEEKAEPQPEIILDGAPPPPPVRYRNYDEDDDSVSSADAPRQRAGAGPRADKPAKDRVASRAKKAAAAEAPSATMMRRPPASPAPTGGYAPQTESYGDEEDAAPADGRERLGLGTEFGEQRSSAASYTRFVRAPGRPIAVAELRYNDAAGLMALGINVQPLPDAGEIMTRETADPFPGDHFARAPR
jgi:hypothetical protein